MESRHRYPRPLAPAILAGLLLALVLAACASDERVVRYHPFLANIPGANSKTAPVGDRFDGYADPTKPVDANLVITNPNGTKKLVSSCIRHMMIHVVNCLADGEQDLLYDQIISEQTKGNYRERGQDPRRFVAFLDEHFDDITTMFSRMPMAEHSPSIILHQPARNTFMLELTGLAAKGSNFTKLWAVMEGGAWKLLWVE